MLAFAQGAETLAATMRAADVRDWELKAAVGDAFVIPSPRDAELLISDSLAKGEGPLSIAADGGVFALPR